MKSVIIYTYYTTPSSDYNLNFFVSREISARGNIDYIIVINGYVCDEKIKFPQIENLTILKRENTGYDFGGHHYALEHLKELYLTYDYYFFMNSSVIGPILPHYFREKHWTSVFINKINERVKLVGTSIVCLPKWDSGGYGPKVEGFFFMTDSLGLYLLQKEGNIFCNHKDKIDAVVNGEYGMSNCILRKGFSIDCMLPRYQNIDWRDSANYSLNNQLHPSRKDSFYGKSINPYDVIFHKWFWHNAGSVNFNIVEQYVDEWNSIK